MPEIAVLCRRQPHRARIGGLLEAAGGKASRHDGTLEAGALLAFRQIAIGNDRL